MPGARAASAGVCVSRGREQTYVRVFPRHPSSHLRVSLKLGLRSERSALCPWLFAFHASISDSCLFPGQLFAKRVTQSSGNISPFSGVSSKPARLTLSRSPGAGPSQLPPRPTARPARAQAPDLAQRLLQKKRERREHSLGEDFSCFILLVHKNHIGF